MKKKYISLLLIFAMMCMMFAACSKQNDNDEGSGSVNAPEGEVYESAEGLVDENGELVEQEGNGISFKQEDDDAKLVIVIHRNSTAAGLQLPIKPSTSTATSTSRSMKTARGPAISPTKSSEASGKR